MKTLKLVSFNGYCYSTDEGEHLATLETAKKMKGTRFQSCIKSLDIGKKEDGTFGSHSYYSSDKEMITDKEQLFLESIGVNLSVHRVVPIENVGKIKTVAFYAGLASFFVWNLAALAIIFK